MLHVKLGGAGPFAAPINAAIVGAATAASLPLQFVDGLVELNLDLPPGRRVELALDVLGTFGFERVDGGYEVDAPVAYAAPAQVALKLPDARLRHGRAVWLLVGKGSFGPVTIQSLLTIGLRVS